MQLQATKLQIRKGRWEAGTVLNILSLVEGVTKRQTVLAPIGNSAYPSLPPLRVAPPRNTGSVQEFGSCVFYSQDIWLTGTAYWRAHFASFVAYSRSWSPPVWSACHSLFPAKKNKKMSETALDQRGEGRERLPQAMVSFSQLGSHSRTTHTSFFYLPPPKSLRGQNTHQPAGTKQRGSEWTECGFLY